MVLLMQWLWVKVQIQDLKRKQARISKRDLVIKNLRHEEKVAISVHALVLGQVDFDSSFLICECM